MERGTRKSGPGDGSRDLALPPCPGPSHWTGARLHTRVLSWPAHPAPAPTPGAAGLTSEAQTGPWLKASSSQHQPALASCATPQPAPRCSTQGSRPLSRLRALVTPFLLLGHRPASPFTLTQQLLLREAVAAACRAGPEDPHRHQGCPPAARTHAGMKAGFRPSAPLCLCPIQLCAPSGPVTPMCPVGPCDPSVPHQAL